MRELHGIIREHSAGEREYKKHIDSLKNSVLTAFYTPASVVEATAMALYHADITPSRLLDPSAGVGIFGQHFGLAVPDCEIECYEKDLITAKILNSIKDHWIVPTTVHAEGFQSIPEDRNGYFDIVASNIPFGDTKVYDRAFERDGDPVRKMAQKGVHNYFFVKGIDTLREGGILAFITSQGVMNSPKNEPIRAWLMQRCNLVSAVRLPNNLFIDKAGTEVGSDLIVLQKNSAKTGLTPNEERFIATFRMNGQIDTNSLFETPDRIIHTEAKQDTDPYGQPAMVYKHSGGSEGIARDLRIMLDADIASQLDRQLYLGNHPQPPAQQAVISESQQQSPAFEPVTERLGLFETGSVFGDALTPAESIMAPKRAKKATSKESAAPSSGGLFDLFGQGDLFAQAPQEELTSEQVTEIAECNRIHQEEIEAKRKQELEPRPFTGKLQPFYRNGTIVQQEGQYGYLKNVNSSKAMFHPLKLSTMQQYRAEAYIPLRDTYQQLYRLEARNEREYKGLRKKLNALYYRFATTIGDLNAKENAKFILMDATGRELLALERFENGKKIKADIFEIPVSYNINEVTHVDTAHEALLASLNKHGKVDLKYMANLSDIGEQELITELEGRIYYNPMVKDYEISDRFIAGNVVSKAE